MRAARFVPTVVAALLIGLVPAATSSATPPAINAVVTAGLPGQNGWWVSNITVNFEVTGTVTSISGCGLVSLTTEGVHELHCVVSGPEGSAQLHPIFRVDKTPPAVTGASPSRGPDANGWYNKPLTVGFSGSDGVSGLAGCSTASYNGPDAKSTTVAGSCVDVAGHTAGGTFTFAYDSTPPDVTAAPERPPDANGWYNKPVKLALGGGDTLSGLESCSSATYEGPDASPASVTGSCRDVAGNAASRTVAIRYDATPPAVSGVAAAVGNRAITLRWAASNDTATITVLRRPDRRGSDASMVYRGRGRSFTDRGLRNGLRYVYTVLGADEAGNVAEARALATPRALITPADGARVRRPPVLSWFPAAGAAYYNVQLFRGRTKVLSIWPARPKLALRRSWSYNGRTFRLVPGRYRWYVWPGVGARKANRYGTLLGGSFFVVVR
jgi:hypothetical protein